MSRTRGILVLAGLVPVAALALLAAVTIGSVELEPGAIIEVFGGGGDTLARTLVLELRLPRALSAFTVGGMLALAGALMQVLLRNPLADPYILGVSAGAAVAALVSMLAGLVGWWIDAAAFGGALAVTLLVFVLAHGAGGWTPLRLLLTGVVIASGLGAVISLLLAISPDTGLRGMLFWLMGDFSFSTTPWHQLVLLTGALLLCLVLARPLNVLARGEAQATILGIEVRPLRIGIYLLSSLLTAIAVTTAGSIGFVGLVVPHLLRLMAGADHRIVLPGAVLLGGALLVLADTLARTVLAPRQLPVGALTALVGVPLFLLLLQRGRAGTIGQ